MKSLLAWLDMAPLENVARVLESAFFPQWHSALKRWLRTEACDETCFGKVFYREILQGGLPKRAIAASKFNVSSTS